MMASADRYTGIAAPAEGAFKDKGSRFLAFAYPVADESEVKSLVDNLRKEHHSARHHCYAYRLGADGNVARCCDDGEPSGTAGKPILATIEKYGLSDVLIVVVRYFGGVLLGVPGLARAYRQAAADALEKAVTVEKVMTEKFRLSFGYEAEDSIMRMLRSEGAESGIRISDRSFGSGCSMTVEVPLGSVGEFIEKINRYNYGKSTRIQCGPLQAAAGSN